MGTSCCWTGASVAGVGASSCWGVLTERRLGVAVVGETKGAADGVTVALAKVLPSVGGMTGFVVGEFVFAELRRRLVLVTGALVGAGSGLEV